MEDTIFKMTENLNEIIAFAKSIGDQSQERDALLQCVMLYNTIGEMAFQFDVILPDEFEVAGQLLDNYFSDKAPAGVRMFGFSIKEFIKSKLS